MVKKVLDGIWEVPWSISVEIRRIRILMMGRDILVEHIYRGGNRLTDFLDNHVFYFAVIKRFIYITM